MSGNRRRPWRVRVTTGWTVDPELMKAKQLVKDIGYYATRQEAIKALANYNDNPFDITLASVTFGQCYEEAKKSFTDGRKNNYYAAYKYLKPIKDMPIRQIKAVHMQRCIDACQTTQQIEIRTVCHKVYKYALQNEIVEKDPSKYLHSNTIIRKEREVISVPDIKRLESENQWWSKIIIMLLYSGMRTKELKDLQPEQIDIENRTVDIRIAKNRPSVRKIPIHSHVLPLFYDYKVNGCNLYGYTHDGLNKALKAFCNHTAHDCRHTFTTHMRQCGCDPLTIQILLGHAPTTITERVYTHVTIEELSESLELLQY